MKPVPTLVEQERELAIRWNVSMNASVNNKRSVKCSASQTASAQGRGAGYHCKEPINTNI